MRGQSRLSTFGVKADFFTVGYERLSVEELFFLLKGADVRCLADVRANPWSQVPDYCTVALEERLRTLGELNEYSVEYVSIRELGNPFRDDGWKEQYRQSLSSKNEAIERLYAMIRSRPTALMCYEKDPSDCHRSILSAILRERYGIEPSDLRQ